MTTLQRPSRYLLQFMEILSPTRDPIPTDVMTKKLPLRVLFRACEMLIPCSMPTVAEDHLLIIIHCGPVVCLDVWRRIHELGISRKRKTHRGSKGRRRPKNLERGVLASHQIALIQAIPVLVNRRKDIQLAKKRNGTRNNLKQITVQKKKKIIYDLPRIVLSNVRSINNKLDEIDIVANVNKVDIISLTETWIDETTPIESLDIQGYVLFSKPRIGRKGGGVALYVKDCFNPRILPVTIPDVVEALWVFIRPKLLPREMSCIVVCVLYFSPRSQYENEYIDHITSTIDDLLMRHPDAGIFVMGDINDLDIESILHNDNFHQVVNLPTRENNILDKIIMNCDKFYLPVTIMSPLGKSDHNCVVLNPVDSIVRSKGNIKRKINRPLPDSGLRSFGQWITHHSWSDVLQLSDPSEKCALLIDTTMSKLDEFLPIKEVQIRNDDKPWMTPQLKAIINEREKAFQKKDKTLWRTFINKVNKMIISAKDRYYNLTPG